MNDSGSSDSSFSLPTHQIQEHLAFKYKVLLSGNAKSVLELWLVQIEMYYKCKIHIWFQRPSIVQKTHIINNLFYT